MERAPETRKTFEQSARIRAHEWNANLSIREMFFEGFKIDWMDVVMWEAKDVNKAVDEELEVGRVSSAQEAFTLVEGRSEFEIKSKQKIKAEEYARARARRASAAFRIRDYARGISIATDSEKKCGINPLQYFSEYRTAVREQIIFRVSTDLFHSNEAAIRLQEDLNALVGAGIIEKKELIESPRLQNLIASLARGAHSEHTELDIETLRIRLALSLGNHEILEKILEEVETDLQKPARRSIVKSLHRRGQGS